MKLSLLLTAGAFALHASATVYNTDIAYLKSLSDGNLSETRKALSNALSKHHFTANYAAELIHRAIPDLEYHFQPHSQFSSAGLLNTELVLAAQNTVDNTQEYINAIMLPLGRVLRDEINIIENLDDWMGSLIFEDENSGSVDADFHSDGSDQTEELLTTFKECMKAIRHAEENVAKLQRKMELAEQRQGMVQSPAWSKQPSSKGYVRNPFDRGNQHMPNIDTIHEGASEDANPHRSSKEEASDGWETWYEGQGSEAEDESPSEQKSQEDSNIVSAPGYNGEEDIHGEWNPPPVEHSPSINFGEKLLLKGREMDEQAGGAFQPEEDDPK